MQTHTDYVLLFLTHTQTHNDFVLISKHTDLFVVLYLCFRGFLSAS